MAGLAMMILIVIVGGCLLDVGTAMKGSSSNAFKDIGKIGVGALAAKEVCDIITKNNKHTPGSGEPLNTEMNPNDPF